MFYPLFCLLYLISKSIFRIIDAMLACCKVMCGLDSIYINGQESDFLTFFLFNEKVVQGFKVTLILGVVLVCAFAIAAIIRTVMKEKVEGTPGQIVGKSVKCIFEFLFVPTVMIAVIYLGNTFINAIYTATAPSGTQQLGNYLCGAFSQEGLKGGVDPLFYTDPGFRYTDTDLVFDYVDYEEFDYFFSWIAGFGIMMALASSLMMFVDRAISIALLFVLSPIPISTSIVDDGAHFKLWRDQILVKFLTGYGVMLGINMYAILISAISDPEVVLISTDLANSTILSASFLNNIIKIGIIVGGAFSLQRIMALVGNLIQAGAGSNELREASMAASGAGGAIKGLAKGLLKGTRGVYNFARDTHQYGLGTAVAKAAGLRSSRDYKTHGWSNDEPKGDNSSSDPKGNHSDAQPQTGENSNLQKIIEGNDSGKEKKKDENNNNGNKGEKKQSPMQNMINSSPLSTNSNKK